MKQALGLDRRLGTGVCLLLLVSGCSTNKSHKPQFTWYEEALSVGGIATNVMPYVFVQGDLQKLEYLGSSQSLTTAEWQVGRTVLENCAANIGYPVEHLGWNLQASMLMTCLNAKGWTVEYSEVSF